LPAKPPRRAAAALGPFLDGQSGSLPVRHDGWPV
jgi:hypothetical protein